MNLSDLIALGGVIANLLVALAAVMVPAWQRRLMLSDARTAETRSWNHFIEAFKELAAAQDAVVAAAMMAGNSSDAFAAAETKLRGAMDAFATSLANSLPVKAAINASHAQEISSKTMAQLPTLKLYGSNLFSYDEIQAKLQEACDATHRLLHQTRRLQISN